MKNLATIIFISLITIGLFSVVTYTSCKKSEQQDVLSCKNGGTYVDGGCKCLEGFEGKLCETKVDYCKQTGCQNGGMCVGFCRCPEGYFGKYCEIDSCKGVVCNNGGVCKVGRCACPAGYSGPKCDTLLKPRFVGRWKSMTSCSSTIKSAILVIDDNAPTNAAQVHVSYSLPYGPFETKANIQYDGVVRPEIMTMYVLAGYWLGFTIESDGTNLRLAYTSIETGYGVEDKCVIDFVRE